jgi:hypothetical protein
MRKYIHKNISICGIAKIRPVKINEHGSFPKPRILRPDEGHTG